MNPDEHDAMLPSLAKRGMNIPMTWEAIATAQRLVTGMGEAATSAAVTSENLIEALREKEIFESPTWKRAGTESYFAEAIAAGFYGVDEATGEAFRYVGPEPGERPANSSAPAHNTDGQEKIGHQRVLVEVDMPHVEDLTEGNYGPKMLLVYHWDRAPYFELQPGDIVVTPRAPHDRTPGLKVGVVRDVQRDRVASIYDGKTRGLLAAAAPRWASVKVADETKVADVRNVQDALKNSPLYFTAF